MSLQIEKIRDKADRVFAIVAEASRWLALVVIVSGIGVILVSVTSKP